MEKLKSWSDRLQGAKYMLYRLNDTGCLDLCSGISKNKGKKVYHQAIFSWLMEDLKNIDHYLKEEPLYFTDHIKDKKGKLISCKVTLNKPEK